MIQDPQKEKIHGSESNPFAPSKAIVATNFTGISSAKTQREFTEDILLMAEVEQKSIS